MTTDSPTATDMAKLQARKIKGDTTDLLTFFDACEKVDFARVVEMERELHELKSTALGAVAVDNDYLRSELAAKDAEIAELQNDVCCQMEREDIRDLEAAGIRLEQKTTPTMSALKCVAALREENVRLKIRARIKGETEIEQAMYDKMVDDDCEGEST